MTDTNRRIYYTLLSSASHSMPPLIPEFKDDTSMTTMKWSLNSLMNSMCACVMSGLGG